MSRIEVLVSVSLAVLLTSCSRPDNSIRDASASADEFLARYNAEFVKQSTMAQEASWLASTDVTKEHDDARVKANKEFAKFAGDKEVITTARELLSSLRSFRPVTAARELQERQLEKVLLAAAESPGTIPEIVSARVEAESRQASIQDGFQFQIDGKPVSANGIDDILGHSTDLAEREKAWRASKEIGKPLRDGLVELQKLRNAVAKEMGHSSFYALQVADYDMTVEEMNELLEGFIRDTRPLYLELHTWVKHKLAERYRAPVPEGTIPAHWINNRWSQNWTGIVEGASFEEGFQGKTPEWIVKQAEAFYTSLGFAPLPATFWQKSDLYPVPAGDSRKKNSHASAWHVDLGADVRSLMSVQANERWFGTAHHELGHIYYYMAYTRPEVPPILRAGANRGFHEGIGELINIASRQTPYLKQMGIIPADREIDTIQFLLDEALSETIPFIAWSAGVMSHWEADLYEGNLPPAQYNQRWWEYVRRYQGIEPPSPRGEEFCDPATKTHVNDDPAQYYDYAIATVLKYQLHDRIARTVLHQDPLSCNYFGHAAAGNFLRSILRQGATLPWREVLHEATGEPLSTRAMMEYFQPLLVWLRKENAGRKVGWE